MVSRIALYTTLLVASSGLLQVNAAGYSYDPASLVGPALWATLAIDDNQCGGTSNSPIAVASSACSEYADYTFTPGSCTMDDMTFAIENNGVKASYSPNCTASTVVVPGVDAVYDALQFHIHTSSEHTIDGHYFGAELHIVHTTAATDVDNSYAVVGMMIEPSAPTDNVLFGYLLAGWEDAAMAVAEGCGLPSARRGLEMTSMDNEHRRLQTLNIYGLLNPSAAFYNYDGGLTTPPCSEVVEWNLSESPVSISVSQYNHLVSLILGYIDPAICEEGTIASPSGSTSRPVVAISGRQVNRICPTLLKPSTDNSGDSGSTPAPGKGGKGLKHRMMMK